MESKPTGFRWVILLMEWLILFFLMASWFGPAAIIPLMATSLTLTPDQIALMFSIPVLMGLFFSIPGGLLGSQIGAKKTIFIGVILGLIASLMKYYATDFITMLASMLIVGAGVNLSFPNMPALISRWFPMKQIGTAIGIMMTSMGIGTSITMYTTPYLADVSGAWQYPFLVYSIFILICVVAWWALVKDQPGKTGEQQSGGSAPISITQGLSHVAKSRNLWLLAGEYFVFMAGYYGILSLLPYILIVTKGIDMVLAAAMASALTWGTVVGMIIGPAISDRIGLRKPVLYAGLAIMAIMLFVASIVGAETGILLWIVLFVGGVAIGMPAAVTMAVPVELKEVGYQYMAAGTGLVTSIGLGLGGFLGPFVSGYIPMTTLLPLYAGLAVVGILFILPLRETGSKSKKPQ